MFAHHSWLYAFQCAVHHAGDLRAQRLRLNHTG
jgi:hypothetical protein